MQKAIEMRPAFRELHGIEVDAELAERAHRRFLSDSRVKIHHGSSLDVLPKILNPARTTLFWLDAHYDGVRPTSFDPKHGQNVLIGELRIILALPWRPLILIDDASTFCSDRWWDRFHGTDMNRGQNPTFQQIYDAFAGELDTYNLLVHNRAIHCLPR